MKNHISTGHAGTASPPSRGGGVARTAFSGTLADKMWTNSSFASLKTVPLIKTRLVSNQFSSEIGAAEKSTKCLCPCPEPH